MDRGEEERKKMEDRKETIVVRPRVDPTVPTPASPPAPAPARTPLFQRRHRWHHEDDNTCWGVWLVQDVGDEC